MERFSQKAEYGPLQADEQESFAALVSAALHTPADQMQHWIALAGMEHFRAMRLNGRTVAGVGLLRMGQWFGGVAVPTVGITAVGVAAEQRGTGVGLAMIREALEETHAAGFPLSTLYPATLSFYQKAGYERAGQRTCYELAVEAVTVLDRSLKLVCVEDTSYNEFYRAYDERARRTTGPLDRPAWLWKRNLEPEQKRTFRYLVQRDGQTEGYIVFTSNSDRDPLTVQDVCVLTPAAGQRLLTLFADHRSQVRHMTWCGGALDPLVYLVREPLIGGTQQVRVVSSIDWLLRIVDVARALRARGYPPGLQAELHFAVHDDLFLHNNGHFVLQVADGQGQVETGGQGRIRLGVRELASIYSGFMHPTELCAIGAIHAPAADLALAGAVFAGPRPWMPDMF